MICPKSLIQKHIVSTTLILIPSGVIGEDSRTLKRSTMTISRDKLEILKDPQSQARNVIM